MLALPFPPPRLRVGFAQVRGGTPVVTPLDCADDEAQADSKERERRRTQG